MVLHDFLVQLHESGHVAVAPYTPTILTDEPSDTFAPLRRMDHDARLEFPGVAPAFSWPTAHWAAETFYRACQLLVCRDVSAEEVRAALRPAGPQPPSAEAHYSADLVFHYLPDLFGVAQRLAAGDALVDSLRSLALAWPLSSVGIADLRPGDLADLRPILDHRGLRQLYADRILQHRDKPRLHDPRAKAAVLTTLGHHAAALCPEFLPAFNVGPTPALP